MGTTPSKINLSSILDAEQDILDLVVFDILYVTTRVLKNQYIVFKIFLTPQHIVFEANNKTFVKRKKN
jgi:hypothetical protein